MSSGSRSATSARRRPTCIVRGPPSSRVGPLENQHSGVIPRLMERLGRGEGGSRRALAACHDPGVSPSGIQSRTTRRRRTHMRKRLLLPTAILIAVVAAAVLAAASAGRTSASAPAAKSAPSGTVTLNGWQVSPAEETKLAKVVKDFERSHPNIKVNYQSVTGDYQAQELAKFAARKPP